jgi:hypothetical protein
VSNLPSERRLEDLERSVKFLTEQLNAIGRRGRFGYPLQTRLVKAIDPYEGDYPDDGATVFPVRFLDGDFDPTPGEQSVTYRERAAEERTQAGVFNLLGDYIEEGDVFPAFQLPPIEGTDGGRWWSYIREGGTVRYRNDENYGGTQPVGAIMDVTGYDSVNKAFTVAQPSANRFSPLWLVGGTQTTFGGYGTGRFFADKGVTLATDPGEGAASYGQMWGPKPGSWLAFKDREGFFAARASGANLMRAFPRFTNELLIKLREDLDQGDSTSADVLYRTATQRRDSGFRLPEVFDCFLNTDETIEKKTIAVARFYCGRWCLFSAYCAPDDTEEESLAARSSGMWTVDGSLSRPRSPGTFF